jgi:hypothetical protein
MIVTPLVYVYILYIKFFFYFQILDEEVFLELSLKDLVSHLKRLNGMGLEDSKILQAVKCWVIHSVDDRQTMGYMVSNFSWVIHSVDDRQTMGYMVSNYLRSSV